MNQLILSTTGTSIANGCPSLQAAQGHRTLWEDRLPDLEREIGEKLRKKEYDVQTPQGRRRLSAELNTLDRLDLKPDDRVIFLSTDSAPGRICSEANRKIVESVYGVEVKIERIEGLQVYDAKLLREKGLKNLVRTVLDRYLGDENVRYAYDIVINPTGGYKGVVPFLSVLGMLYGKPSIYLFEFSEELIKLPPLPLTFDLEIYHRVKGALAFLEKEVAAPEEAYLSKIEGYDPSERDLFLSFTEPFDEGMITLSPLAYVLLKIEEGGQTCMVSQTARDQIEAQRGEKCLILERLVANCANPLWRHDHLHRWGNSDFLIIKPGNTSERLAGFMRDGVFHVALAFANHDEYEKELGKYSVKYFDGKAFFPFVPTEIEEEVPSEREELVARIDRLGAEKRVLEEKLLEMEIDREERQKAFDDELRQRLNECEEEARDGEKRALEECEATCEKRRGRLEGRLREERAKIPKGFWAKFKAFFEKED